MVAIVLSGPQATGKTTLAMALGAWVPAAGLRLQTALLARQLELGQSAILECVAPLAARQQWRQMCAAAGARFVSVECTCPDPGEHRARVEQRVAEGRSRLRWDYVTATISRYQADPGADYVAEATRPLPELVRDVLKIAAA